MIETFMKVPYQMLLETTQLLSHILANDLFHSRFVYRLTQYIKNCTHFNIKNTKLHTFRVIFESFTS